MSSEVPHRLRNALRPRYVLERVLGRGGMATVYLADDRRYDRPVAVKVLDPTLANAMGAERFLREIRITAQLQHPHILPLLDSGEAKGYLYAVTPFVNGESLRDKLRAEGMLPVNEALEIARDVARALDYAHRQGIVHRDVKPENILLSDEHPIVADFGIARAIGLAGGQSLTAGQPIGTLPYMSPEQGLDSGEIGAPSDVYSLGCVLYEMLSGRIAFGGATVREVLTRQQQGPPPLATLRPGLPPAVIEVVERAMARDPAERYATARELATRLGELLGEPPRLLTPTDSAGETASVSDERAPDGAEGAGLVTAAPRPRSRELWWMAVLTLVGIAALVAAVVLPSQRRDRREAAAGPSVAVLPLEVRGTRPEDVYLGEGITEEIIARLAQVRGLKVISRTSVVALKEARLTVPQIAETLGVRHVLEGSLQHVGDRIHTRVQLVDARTDATVWQETYQLGDTNLFALQDEIARKVAGALVSTVGAPAPAMSAGTRANRPGAYDAFLRGRYWLARRTPEGMARAQQEFARAIGLDSTYAPAYAGLASANTYSVIYGFRATATDPYTQLAQALDLAERAVQLDTSLAEAYSARADARTLAQYPDSAVRSDVMRAWRLAPNSADVIMNRAFTISRGGQQADSAIALARAAIALDPLSLGLQHSLAVIGLQTRRYAAARAAGERAVARSPDDVPSHVLRGYGLLLSGRPKDCATDRVLVRFAIRAMCLVSLGRTAEATPIVDSLVRRLEAEQYTLLHEYGDLAAYYAWRGDVSNTVRWLQRLTAHTPTLPAWQLDSGLFDRVQGSPEFISTVAELRTTIRDRVQARRGMLVR